MRSLLIATFLLVSVALQAGTDCLESYNSSTLSARQYCLAIVKGSGSGSASGYLSTLSGYSRQSPQQAEAFCNGSLNRHQNDFSSDYNGIFLEACANQFGYSYK